MLNVHAWNRCQLQSEYHCPRMFASLFKLKLIFGLTHWGRMMHRSYLDQLMACRLFGAKPISEPKLINDLTQHGTNKTADTFQTAYVNVRRQVTIYTIADILPIKDAVTNLNEIWITIRNISLKKLKIKWKYRVQKYILSQTRSINCMDYLVVAWLIIRITKAITVTSGLSV